MRLVPRSPGGAPSGSRGGRARRRRDLGRAGARGRAPGTAHTEGRPSPGPRARRLRPRREGRPGAVEDDRGASGHDGDRSSSPNRCPARSSPSPAAASRSPSSPWPPRRSSRSSSPKAWRRPTAASAAEAAGGRLDRARLLARDSGLPPGCTGGERCPAGSTGPGRGSPSSPTSCSPRPPSRSRWSVNDRPRSSRASGSRPSVEARRESRAASAVDERHRRELRRVRTDELRAGLAMLVSVYRERLAEPELSTATPPDDAGRDRLDRRRGDAARPQRQRDDAAAVAAAASRHLSSDPTGPGGTLRPGGPGVI